MASGLIYLIIIGMWGAYFLPRWMSNHEDSSGRSTERFKSAMQVVAQSGSTSSSEELAAVALKKSKVIAQRRLTFFALVALFLSTIFLSAFTFLSWTFILIPTSGVGIYLVNVRRKVQQVSKKEIAKSHPKRTNILEATVEFVISSNSDSVEHWIPLSERTDTSGVTVIPKRNEGWSPVAIPKPTYTTAAKAVNSRRVIDLTVPGVWSAEQELLKALAVPNRENLFDQELEEQAAVVNSDQKDRVVNE